MDSIMVQVGNIVWTKKIFLFIFYLFSIFVSLQQKINGLIILIKGDIIYAPFFVSIFNISIFSACIAISICFWFYLKQIIYQKMQLIDQNIQVMHKKCMWSTRKMQVIDEKVQGKCKSSNKKLQVIEQKSASHPNRSDSILCP